MLIKAQVLKIPAKIALDHKEHTVELTDEFFSKAVKIREREIINLLKKSGVKFNNLEELNNLAKKHCKVKTQGRHNELYFNGIIIAQWWETYYSVFSEDCLEIVVGEPLEIKSKEIIFKEL